MEESEIRFSVNIRSPYTVEDFNNDEKVLESIGRDNFRASSAYYFNVNSVAKYGSPCLRPGFKYMFWFKDEAHAKTLADAYGSEVVYEDEIPS